jgi:hypothetical protein
MYGFPNKLVPVLFCSLCYAPIPVQPLHPAMPFVDTDFRLLRTIHDTLSVYQIPELLSLLWKNVAKCSESKSMIKVFKVLICERKSLLIKRAGLTGQSIEARAR